MTSATKFCLLALLALTGCRPSADESARTLTDRLTSDGWVRSDPNWICERERCGQVSGLVSGKERDALSYYLDLGPDGSARRAYPSKPEWAGWDDGNTTARCQLGSWSLNGSVIELRFQATNDAAAIDDRRTLSYFLDFVRATREGGNDLDYEEWHDYQGERTKATLDAWCPRPPPVHN
jgi:hypothetical protein